VRLRPEADRGPPSVRERGLLVEPHRRPAFVGLAPVDLTARHLADVERLPVGRHRDALELGTLRVADQRVRGRGMVAGRGRCRGRHEQYGQQEKSRSGTAERTAHRDPAELVVAPVAPSLWRGRGGQTRESCATACAPAVTGDRKARLDSCGHGVWRSLVAHPLWERGAVGSNPATPTQHGGQRLSEKPRMSRTVALYASLTAWRKDMSAACVRPRFTRPTAGTPARRSVRK
jgi:hypothetical protein